MAEKVALVTGGLGELGREIGRRLAGQGCRIAAMDIVVDANGDAEQWREEMRTAGHDITVVAGDVCDFDSCREAVKQVKSSVGPIDILVNCAGITRDASFRKMNKQQWDEVVTTNLDSVFNVTKHVIGGMTERGFGRVINISSLNGKKGQYGQCNYSAAKAGMHGFTMALAQEVARKGVTVNTVSPGYMETRMVMAVPERVRQSIIAQIPVGRLGRPSEVAALVGFLASDEAAYVTGANFSINGGHHMG